MLAGTLSIRFVRGDDAYLSMAHGRDSVFLEFLTLSNVAAAPEVFEHLEAIALKFNARPHWGQWFSRSSIPRLRALYPMDEFLRDGIKRFDPTRAFQSSFSRALLNEGPAEAVRRDGDDDQEE